MLVHRTCLAQLLFLVAFALPTPALAQQPAAPKITITPLTELQAAFDSIKTENESVGSFKVSEACDHYLFIKPMGLTQRAVCIDGKAGPLFTRIQSLAYNPDISLATYIGWLDKITQIFVMQQRDGTAHTYPLVAPADPSGWRVDPKLSATLGHLVRVRFVNNGEQFVQLDEQGPGLGPFTRDTPTWVVDPTQQHLFCTYWANGVKSVASDPWQFQLKCFFDQKPVLVDALAAPQVHQQYNGAIQTKITPEGHYAVLLSTTHSVRLPNRNIDSEVFVYSLYLDGKLVITCPDGGPDLTSLQLSPDGHHTAFVFNDNSGKRIFLDGVPQDPFPDVTNLHFTGDSQSLVYIADAGVKRTLVLDGKQLGIEARSIGNLVAGPHAHQFAYITSDEQGKPITVSHLGRAAFPNKNSAPQFLGFSPDGQHIVAFGKNFIVIDGHPSDLTTYSTKEHPNEDLDITPLKNAGASHLQGFITRDGSTTHRAFFGIQIEFN